MSELRKQARSASGVAVRAYEVFIVDETFAKQYAKKYGADLEKVDDGWLVRKAVGSSSEDDPITQAIRKAISDSGLT